MTRDPLSIEPLTGPAIEPAIPELARLRIAVFRDWPYLYEGDAAYEARYLARYVETPGALVVLAREGGHIVGAATGLPLRHEEAAFRAPLEGAGYRAEELFYFGESV
ncbi:MAG: GNAT family N-acetyltransferase, partial [Alphaproteobacteria bacterium]|nr:GNAT family N-acetyltransferase [Alphaproteobacteria bacterium]